MQVAHSDKNTFLFERIKSVISIMAKGQHKGGEASKDEEDGDEEEKGEGGIKANKIIMTEIMSLLLKQNKDP